MTGRLACLVPFCRRTRGVRSGEPPIRPGEEWVCGPHWKLVPGRLKASRRRAKRRAIAADRLFQRRYSEAGNRYWQEWLDEVDRARQVARDRWAACKRAAIEAAGGLR
ncbi:hypothetical protein [Inquilinus sp. CA228]|uniref:hypothetical protein n=1 Tax=Inquilinus sp. CA228 TaxID=3455609 RepID=UPI003F8D74EB